MSLELWVPWLLTIMFFGTFWSFLVQQTRKVTLQDYIVVVQAFLAYNFLLRINSRVKPKRQARDIQRVTCPIVVRSPEWTYYIVDNSTSRWRFIRRSRSESSPFGASLHHTNCTVGDLASVGSWMGARALYCYSLLRVEQKVLTQHCVFVLSKRWCSLDGR